MPGGLVQIITSGTQDITLTGNPQITFFNIIFRRYTNFGKKIIILSFDNEVNFGSTSTITIPKNSGDLLSKLVIRIKIPKIDLSELNTNKSIINILNENLITKYNDYIVYYNYFISFYNKLKNIISIFFTKYDTLTSFSYINDLSKYILTYINVDEFQQFFTSISFFFNNGLILENTSINIELFTNASLYKYINKQLIYIYSNWTEDYLNYDMFKFTINQNLSILNNLNTLIYEKIQVMLTPANNITFTWVNKLAIHLFNSIDLYIGSNKISSLSDYYINNYSNLYYKNTELYNKLVGCNQELNLFSINKDESVLYLPLPFWFNDSYGLAFPLISLQYNSLQLRVNLKKFIECIKININTNIDSLEVREQIINYIINNQFDILKSNLDITMIAEYIYLDNVERKKFAQSAHEYLITQIQEIQFNNLSINNNSFQLDFFHCCKDISWHVVKKFDINSIFDNNINIFSYELNKDSKILGISEQNILNYINILNNPNKLFEPYYFLTGLFYLKNIILYNNDYNIIINNYMELNKEINITMPIIIESYLYINSVVLIGDKNNFFNYLQPYNYYNSTPQKGLNIYSFSLNPTETQPSGSCNLSRIPNFLLKLKINSEIDSILLNNQNNTDSIYRDKTYLNKIYNNMNQYKLIVQVTNYNVLRFIGGIAATAYTY